MPKQISKKLEDKIVALYQNTNFTCVKVAQECGVHSKTVSKILKKNNILRKFRRKRIYTADDHYLDTIDCEEKAYILGIMYADGNLHTNKKNISLGLSGEDLYLLDKIRLLFKSNKPIYTIKRKK